MQKNNSNTFSEKELDNLLNQSFLESHLSKPENEKIIEAISAQAFGLNVIPN